jgi:hypothetical protein
MTNTRPRPQSLNNITNRQLTDEEIDYLRAMLENDEYLMRRIRDGYPQEERHEFGRRFLDAARRHIPDLSMGHAAEALGKMVIKVRGLK